MFEIIDICDTAAEISQYSHINERTFSGSIHISKLKFKDFFNNFMLKNVPCIIQNVTSDWECARKWVKDDQIDYDFIKETYGNLEAPVANCQNIEFNSQCKQIMSIGQFMDYLKNETSQKKLYLKDWHLRRIRPDDKFYETPVYFVLDWLNEYAIDTNEDDFMFVYIGPKGSWTPLHEDVYCSYSWSVNVTGRKKWILFPPGEEEKLKDHLGNLPLIFESEKYSNIKYFEIIQEKGDAVFVPSGWHHQVTNELDTISVNHNWINGCNIGLLWKSLQKTLAEIEKHIEEFKDTPEFPFECQTILKTHFGMNFEWFVKFLCYIARKRVSQLEGNTGKVFEKYIIGNNIIKFDLKNILKVMNSIVLHPIFLNKKVLATVETELLEVINILKTLCTNV